MASAAASPQASPIRRPWSASGAVTGPPSNTTASPANASRPPSTSRPATGWRRSTLSSITKNGDVETSNDTLTTSLR